MYRFTALILLLLFLLPASLQAGENPVFDARERAAIRALVEEVLREKPEILLEAVRALRERQQRAEADVRRQVILDHRAQLERDPNSPVGGNPDGDVTIVEFFDYRCPYCKAVAETVKRLLEEDGNIRLVYKEWPILGEVSRIAARAALAARAQGRYLEYHDRLMAERKLTGERVFAIAEEIGLDVERLRADMEAPEVERHLRETAELADALGISGTPAFVIGDHLLPGLADRATFEALVRRARGES